MDHRKHCAKIKVDAGDKSFSVRLFPATEWPEHAQSDRDLYRLQKGRAWLSPNGEKYAFWGVGSILDIVGKFLSDQGYIARLESPRPDFQPGQRVRWTPTLRGDAKDLSKASVLTTILTIPVQTADGVWRVFLRGAQAGLVPFEPVPCDEVTPI